MNGGAWRTQTLGFQVQDAQTMRDQASAEIQKLQQELGAAKTQPEIDAIDKEIETKQAELKTLEEQVEEINARPDVAPFAAHVRRANAPFEARG